MLTEVECEGYKTFSARTRLSLRPLTVIFGKNNSGKTTLARLPLFAAASLASRGSNYVLSVDDIRFGSSFADLASSDQPHPRIFLRMRWEQQAEGEEPTARSLARELQYVSSGIERHDVQARRLIIDDEPPVEFKLSKPSDGTIRAMNRDRLTRDEVFAITQRRDFLQRLVRDTIHIPSARAKVETTYATREPNAWTLGEVPYLLATNNSLMSEVAAWFESNMNGLVIDVDLAAFAFRLVEVHENVAVSLSESGRGTQSVLPVVALLLAVARLERRARLIVVEEPEEHLHPSAHGALGDLLIEASGHSQIVVETHSENLILRLRRRIAEGAINPDQISFCYVDEDHNAVPIEIDAQGIAANWPVGVFEEDAEEAQAIVQAKLAAMGPLGTGE